jgi:hypothetical protein
LWLLPHWMMGAERHWALSQRVERNMLNMWLQVQDTAQTWSLTNFIHYRLYIDPIWSELSTTPPYVYQLICLLVTLLVGLPTLHILLRNKWSHMQALPLWEDISMIGVAWALIDPDGRTHHYVTLVPAYCYLIFRRLEAWHERGAAPERWQWLCYLIVAVTNLWLVRLPEPVAHHFYMHYGLYPAGMLLLYALIYHEIRVASRNARREMQTTKPTRLLEPVSQAA